jgi:hypothetical protein
MEVVAAIGSRCRPLHHRDTVAGASLPPSTAPSSREPSSSSVSHLRCPSYVPCVTHVDPMKSASQIEYPNSISPYNGEPASILAMRRHSLSSVATARTCSRLGPLDHDPTDQIRYDPSQLRSSHRSNRAALLQFSPELLDFTSRPFHRSCFLTDKSKFFQFSPEALVYLADKSLILYRSYLLHYSSIFSVLYVHAIVSTSRLVFCCFCFCLI